MGLQRLSRPEYTGVNRCRACTVVNVAVLLVAVGVVGVWRPLVALGVGLVGGVVITLRGYLIPFTPRFAPALVAPLPGDFFHADAPDASDGLSDLTAEDVDREAVLQTLVEAGVVTVDGDHLGLHPEFEAAWGDRMETLAAASDERLAAAACETSPTVTSARVERTGAETYLVVSAGERSAAWIRRPVALAESAAVEALCDTDVPSEHRAVAANALCVFLETCPACGDDLVEGRLDDCCGHSLDGSGTSPTHGLACAACGVVFHRFE